MNNLIQNLDAINVGAVHVHFSSLMSNSICEQNQLLQGVSWPFSMKTETEQHSVVCTLPP